MDSVKITLAYFSMLILFGVIASFMYSANPGSIDTVIPCIAGIMLASLAIGMLYGNKIEKNNFS